MCPAFAAVVNPEKVTVTVRVCRFGESEIIAVPVPAEAFGGTS